VQIYCYNKCGIILEEFNPHLPFGDFLGRFNPHLPFGDFLGGFFFHFLQGQKGFLYFFVVYIVDKGV